MQVIKMKETIKKTLFYFFVMFISVYFGALAETWKAIFLLWCIGLFFCLCYLIIKEFLLPILIKKGIKKIGIMNFDFKKEENYDDQTSIDVEIKEQNKKRLLG